jgi:hypothetical protein
MKRREIAGLGSAAVLADCSARAAGQSLTYRREPPASTKPMTRLLNSPGCDLGSREELSYTARLLPLLEPYEPLGPFEQTNDQLQPSNSNSGGFGGEWP